MMSNPSSEEQEALKKTASEPRSQCTENGQGPRQEGGTPLRKGGMAATSSPEVKLPLFGLLPRSCLGYEGCRRCCTIGQ